MEIKIQQLRLLNFKGARDLTIDFEKETTIYGFNGTFKTTCADAFRWLMFGKNSRDEANFEIKTLNPDNTPIHNLDHTVEGRIIVDGTRIILKKTFKEKWVKPRGKETPEMQGHETTYYYNDIPVTQRDYQKKIDEICQEQTFKMLTDPNYFPSLHWEKQREMVSAMIEEVTTDSVAQINPRFRALIDTVTALNVSLIQYRKHLSSEKDRIRHNPDTGLDFIPSRISEAQRSIPPAQDWAGIEKKISSLQSEIDSIDVSITDSSKGLEAENEKRLDLQRQIGEKKNQKLLVEQKAESAQSNASFEYDRQVRIAANVKRDLEDTVRQNENRITDLRKEIEGLRVEREQKIEAWKKINAETLQYSEERICPLTQLPCNALPETFLESEREEALRKFNQAKSVRLETNVSEGKKIVARIQEAELKITTCENIITETRKKLEECQTDFVAPNYEEIRKKYLEENKYQDLLTSITELETALASKGEARTIDTSELQARKREKQTEKEELQKQLAARDQIVKGNARVKELTDLQKALSQKLSDVEKEEFTLKGFEDTRIDLIEQRVNALFENVQFKMFNRLINGETEPTCMVMIGGVPYSSLNTGGRIQAGLEIVRVMADHYGVYAPIWIDNRESVFRIPEMKNQIIHLVASIEDRTLRVAYERPFVMAENISK